MPYRLRYALTLLLASTIAVTAAHGQTQINPLTQIKWPALTGSGAPPNATSGACTSGNQGQRYTDTSTTPSNDYLCAKTSSAPAWQASASGGGATLAYPALVYGLTATTSRAGVQGTDYLAGMIQGASSSPVVYDLFQTDYSNINSNPTGSGNSTWTTSGSDASFGKTSGGYLTDGNSGTGILYANVLNSFITSGTPQPVTSYGESAVFCSASAGATLGSQPAAEDLTNVIHMIWGPTGYLLTHKYGATFYSLNTGVLNLSSDCSTDYAMSIKIAYPTQYLTTGTWGSGATSITVASATGIVAGENISADPTLGLPVGTLVGSGYVSGTTIPITTTTTAANTAVAVVSGAAQLTINAPGIPAFTTADPFVGTLGSWQAIPVSMFVEPGAVSGVNATKYGSVWMGGPTQTSKEAAAGGSANLADVVPLKGAYATAQHVYPAINIPISGTGGAGWYRLATAGYLANTILSGSFTISAQNAGCQQVLKFSMNLVPGGTPYIIEKDASTSICMIDAATISTDNGSNVAVDIHLNSNANVNPTNLTVTGIGLLTPATTFTVGATAYVNSATFSVSPSTIPLPPPTLTTTGWFTIATDGGGWPGYNQTADLSVTVVGALGAQYFTLHTAGQTNGCSINQNYSTSANIISAARCSWSGSALQFDIYNVAGWVNGSFPLTVTATALPLGAPITISTTLTGGATPLGSGNSVVQIINGQLYAPPISTVANLPGSTNFPSGTILSVSDSLTSTPGACTGGGSTVMLAVATASGWYCR